MSQTITTLRKYSILIHRWMGVGFCVLFVVWFISGIVMMYWDYPRWTDAKRLPRLEKLSAPQIRISPEEAYRSLELTGAPDRVRINMLDGRPVYRFHYGSSQLIVYADDAQPFQAIPPEMAVRLASARSGQPAGEARFRGLLEVDQWTVHPSVRPFGPFLKYSWPNGEEVYVSQASGEVVQHTTRGDRFWAWLGAIPHWFYFTSLRDDADLWRDVVVWSSGIGTVMSLFGIVVGVWLYSPSKRRFRFPEKTSGIHDAPQRLWRAVVSPEGRSSIPYSGQKRWHTMLGLIFGLFACTWALSGMLSLSPFEWLVARTQVPLAEGLRGAEWRPEPFSAQHPREALQQAGSLAVKELELAFVGGEPVYFAAETPERSLIVPVSGAPRTELDPEHLAQVLAKAAQPHAVAEFRVVREYEAYYVDRGGRHSHPLPVVFARLNDAESSMYYVDLRTGRIVKSYGEGLRWHRWLYNGLHSFDVPWLYRYRPAWDVVVLLLMLGGTALCVTSVIIGWRRLRRKVAMRSARASAMAQGAPVSQGG